MNRLRLDRLEKRACCLKTPSVPPVLVELDGKLWADEGRAFDGADAAARALGPWDEGLPLVIVCAPTEQDLAALRARPAGTA